MLWIQSHLALGNHPKTRKLCLLLGVTKPTAVGHLHYLWWWAFEYAQDGDLSRFDVLDIAIAGEWDGDPGAFVDALTSVGFLDRDGDALSIHDWADNGGKLIEKRKADAERKRTNRAKSPLSTGHPPDIHVTAHVEQNRTERTAQNSNSNRAQKPPPQDIHVTYETVLNGAMDEAARRFAVIDKQYTDGWFKGALVAAELEVGPLSRSQLGRAIDLALDQIRRAVDSGKVKSPRPFAQKVLTDYLLEQRDEHHAS